MAVFPSFPSPLSPPSARWQALTQVEACDRRIAARMSISPVSAAILRARGHASAEAIEAFFAPHPGLLRDAADLPDIERAIDRLWQAIQDREAILIFGDYDVDGITSTALMVRSLQKLGAQVSYRLPERDESYGLTVAAVDEAATRKISLIVTADCGITAVDAARRARELNIDLIVTDHHEPEAQLPDAVAIVNPKRADSKYEFTGLSGCGVVYKLMTALLKRYQPGALNSFSERYLDLVALSTIADCVPLHDENRYLVARGLHQLYGTRKKGLRALIESANLRDKGFYVGGDVSFKLAPRLNAAGRLDSPTLALRLLLSNDEAECADLAAQIEALNGQRRTDTDAALLEAHELVEREANLSDDRLLIAAGRGWRRGVVGLLAAKLVDKYHRPAFALNIENGHAHGSGRSHADFDLHALLEESRELIVSGGGHAGACGLTVETCKLPQFREHALEYAADKLSMEELVPRHLADCEAPGRDVTLQLAQEMMQLEPCGTGNHAPVLLLRGARLQTIWPLKADHSKGRLMIEGQSIEWIWWRSAPRLNEFERGDNVDCLFVPEVNEYRGQVSLQLTLKDMRISGE